MKTLIRKTLATLALAAGFSSAAWAATPTVVWDGDFGTTSKVGTDNKTYTFNANGNTVDNGVIQITQAHGATIEFPAENSGGYTVVIKYSNLSAVSDRMPIFAGFRTSYASATDYGVAASSNGGLELSGYWFESENRYDFNTPKPTLTTGSGYVVLAHKNGSKTRAYAGATLAGATGSDCGLKFSYGHATMIGLGGASKDSTSATCGLTGWTDLKIEAVAVFAGQFYSASDVASFKFLSDCVPSISLGFDNGKGASTILGGTAPTSFEDWNDSGVTYTKVRGSDSNYAMTISGSNPTARPAAQVPSGMSDTASWSVHGVLKLAAVNNGVLFGLCGTSWRVDRYGIGVERKSADTLQVVYWKKKTASSTAASSYERTIIIDNIPAPNSETYYHSYLLTFNKDAAGTAESPFYTLYFDGVAVGNSGATQKCTGCFANEKKWCVGTYYGGAEQVGANIFSGAQIDDFAIWEDTCLTADLAMQLAGKFPIWKIINYAAMVSDATAIWSSKSGLTSTDAWSNGGKNTIALGNTSQENATLTFDEDVTAERLTLTSDAEKNTTLEKADGATVAISAYDFSGANGKVTVGFDTGAATITAGADTVLNGTGTGKITMAANQKVTVGNNHFGGNLTVSGGGSVVGPASSTLVFDLGDGNQQQIEGSSDTATDRVFGMTVKSGTLYYSGDGSTTAFNKRTMTADGATAVLKIGGGDATGYSGGCTKIVAQNGGTFAIARRDTLATPLDLCNGTVLLKQGCANSNRGLDLYNNNNWHVIGATGATAQNPTVSALTYESNATADDRKVAMRNGAWNITVDQTAQFDVYATIFKNDNYGGTEGKLVKKGLGRLTLKAANAYTKGTTLEAGTLTIENATALGTAGIDMSGGTTLELNIAGDATVSTVCSGAGAVVKVGSGTTTLSGANTYSGATTVSAGTLKLTGTTFGEGNVTVAADATFDVGTIRPAGTLDSASAGTVRMTLTEEEKTTFDAKGKVSLMTVSAGTFDNGTVEVYDGSGSKLEIGDLVIEEGVLKVQKATDALTPPYHVTNPTNAVWTLAGWMDSTTPEQLPVTGAAHWANKVGANIAVEAESNITMTADTALTLGTLNITNAGTLAISAAGENTIAADALVITNTGVLTISGNVTVANAIDDSASTGATTIAFNPGAATVAAGDNTILNTVGTGAITIGADKKLTVASGLNKTQLTNNGTLDIVGGTLESPVVINDNGATGTGFGTITIASGVVKDYATSGNKVYNISGVAGETTLILGSGQNWGMTSGTSIRNTKVIVQDKEFWLERTDAFDGTVDLQIDKALHICNNNAYTIGSLSGSANIVKTGSESLTITMDRAASEYSGASQNAMTVAGSYTLTLSGNSTGALTVNEGASVKLTGSASPSAIVNNGTVTYDVPANTTNTVTVAIGGAGTIVKTGEGLLKFMNGYREAVTVVGGKVGYTVNINDEGEFTPPAGMTTAQIELYKADGTKVDAVVEDGKFKFTAEYYGKAALMEYLFTTNLVSTGSDTGSLQFDGTHCFTGNEYTNSVVTQVVESVEVVTTNWAIKAASAPWRNVSFPSAVSVVMYGKMMKTSNACQIGIGSTTGGSMYSLFLAAGDTTKDEVKLAYAYDNDTSKPAGVVSFGTLCTMTVPNAQTTDHLYAFTMQKVGDDTVVNIYLDGELLQPYTFAKQNVTLGSGIQLGSIHGGIGATQDWPDAFGFKRSTDVETTATLDFLRVYDTVLTGSVLKKMAEDYPYVSPNGSFRRTVSGTSTWNAQDSWTNEGTGELADEPTAGSSLKVTASANAGLIVNLLSDAMYEELSIQQGSYVRIAANASPATMPGRVFVSGRTTIGARTTINPQAVVLAGVKISPNQMLGFDLTGCDLGKYYKNTFIELAGVVTKEDGASMRIDYEPKAAAGRTAALYQNPSDQHWGLAIAVEDAPFVYTFNEGDENGQWSFHGIDIDEPDWGTDVTSGRIQKAGTGKCTIARHANFTYEVAAGTLDISGNSDNYGPITVNADAFLDVGTRRDVTVAGSGKVNVKLTAAEDKYDQQTGALFTRAPEATATFGTIADSKGGTVPAGQIVADGTKITIKPIPTVFTVTSITPTAQTNFNGSAVTVAYSAFDKGDYETVTTKLTVNGHDYFYSGDLAAGGGTITFQVADADALASNVVNAVVSVVGSGTTKSADDRSVAYDNAAWLYQGAPVAGGAGTNEWFKTWAEASAVVPSAQGGAWAEPNVPKAEGGRIIIEDDEDTCLYEDFVFAPETAQAGQVAVVDMNLSFDAALENVTAVAGAQAAICVVTTGKDAYRFAAITNGVWATNTEVVAELNTEYPVRLTLDYRQVPATIKYEVLTNGVYETIATGASGTTKSALESVTFNGTGKLALMTGSNVVDKVDASLVKDSEHNKYANIGAAIDAGVTNLTLLWNTAWQPPSGTGAFRISKGSYDWYYTPEDGLLVKLVDGTYVVVTDYWEAMNLVFGADNVTTNKFMYFTNAVALAENEESYTNFYLLRDVTLGEALEVKRSMTFNGEDRILSGSGLDVADKKTFTIEGGCIGIAPTACLGTVALKGGRFSNATKAEWTAPSDYSYVQLAVPVREIYGWQLMPSEIAPKTAEEELLPVTDANGESVSVVVNKTWAQTVTGEEKPADQSATLSEKQGNNLTFLDNAILGLTNSVGQADAGNIPVITPHQSSTADKVKFSLGNVKQQSIKDSGARVKYRVFKSSKPGGKDGGSSDLTDPDKDVQMDLPESGVQYYIIEVDTGAVK